MKRPLCSTCFREAREPKSNRCANCGPGRIRYTNVDTNYPAEKSLADLMEEDK